MMTKATLLTRSGGVTLIAILAGLMLAFSGAAPARAEWTSRLSAPGGVAVGGFDPVAYFIQGAAIPGDSEIALRWRGVRWHFSSPAHRAQFEANPRAYIPQFGGYCVFAMAQGRMAAGDPRNWVIHEGRLYLTETQGGLTSLRDQVGGLVAQAQSNWQGVPAAAE